MERSTFLFAFAVLNLFYAGNCKKDDFLETHWKHPISEQGPVPKNFSIAEAKLIPENCGTCHSEQYELWKKSYHRKSAGDGLIWQLQGLGENKAGKCFQCHSPLKESSLILKKKEGWPVNYPKIMEDYFPSDSDELGISCSSCHVRNHTRYGPPSEKAQISQTNLPHNGYIVQKDFESSEFCKNCHESPSDSNQISGKKMMETYTEWSESDFKKNGIQCQSCHMPKREHRWEGIHDKDMVLSGIEKSLNYHIAGDEVELKAEIKSVKVGHKFPTYAVPKLYLTLFLLGNKEQRKPLGDFTVGRLMDIDLSKEFYDTRIDPGKSVSIVSRIKKAEILKYKQVMFQAKVHPDELYERMFAYNIENKNKLGHTENVIHQIDESLEAKRKSSYILFTLSFSVSDLFLKN